MKNHELMQKISVVCARMRRISRLLKRAENQGSILTEEKAVRGDEKSRARNDFYEEIKF